MHVTAINRSSPHLTHVAPHAHHCWELVVFLQGKGVHQVGEKRIPFQAGTIVCQPPLIPHGTQGDKEYQDLYIQLDGYTPPCEQDVPVFEDDADRQFTSLVHFCLNAFHRENDPFTRLADSLMYAAQQLLIAWSNSTPRDRLVDSFLQALIQGASDPKLNISDLIAKTGYCSDAFRRRFRTATGTTPTAFLIDQRISHARSLLSDMEKGGLSIRQIAFLCGFEDPYYFSTLFRRKTGLSPARYRMKNAALPTVSHIPVKNK